MACYQCKGDGGDDTRLCAKCNVERRNELKKPFMSPEEVPPSPLFTRSNLACFGGLVGAVGLSFCIVCYAPFGPGYGLSKGEQLYRRCLGKAEEAAAPTGRRPTTPAEVQVQRTALNFKKELVLAACNSMRAECAAHPNGKKCASAQF